jgi:hypothetical protein
VRREFIEFGYCFFEIFKNWVVLFGRVNSYFHLFIITYLLYLIFNIAHSGFTCSWKMKLKLGLNFLWQWLILYDEIDLILEVFNIDLTPFANQTGTIGVLTTLT